MRTVNVVLIVGAVVSVAQWASGKPLKLKHKRLDFTDDKRATWLIQRNANNYLQRGVEKINAHGTSKKERQNTAVANHGRLLAQHHDPPRKVRRVALIRPSKSETARSQVSSTKSGMGHYVNGRAPQRRRTQAGAHGTQKLAMEISKQLQRRMFLPYGPNYTSMK